MSRPAAFLDRDGTIVHDTGYLRDPGSVTLIPGAASAIARLRAAGVFVVVVTNQSGIARGYFGWPEYEAVKAAVDRLLAAEGAAIDATFVCPHAPEVTGPCECRKPGLLSYREAGSRFDLDFGRSAWVGDRLSDVEPARAMGGRGILIETGAGIDHVQAALAAGFEVADDLSAAVERYLAGDGAMANPT